MPLLVEDLRHPGPKMPEKMRPVRPSDIFEGHAPPKTKPTPKKRKRKRRRKQKNQAASGSV